MNQVLPEGLPRTILGDSVRLKQILLNILSNAVKFTESGRVELCVTHDSGEIRFSISDTGIGIPEAARDRLFNRFYQVDAFPLSALPTPHPPSDRDIPTGSRVLLVDDNPINRTIATTMLLKMGCKVDIAVNGLEAVAMARTNPYLVILMDCEMPEMDGYQATLNIREWEVSSEKSEENSGAGPCVIRWAKCLALSLTNLQNGFGLQLGNSLSTFASERKP